ncbi:MAG: DUF445 domain-containing protein [Rhodospirillaceae bacterium]|nr:DUF445 domain-containing protein [Rhodospirillaceae bacterium]
MTDTAHAVRMRGLVRMRFLAGALLVLMAALVVIARLNEPRYPLLSYLRAFAEAAMVGGLADWFAVTALFRRPLGLPIPHTAIVTRNQDRIAISVGDFIANNFLSPAVLRARLKDGAFSLRLACWLERDDNAVRVSRRLGTVLPAVIEAFGNEPMRSLLRDAALDRLRRVDAGSLSARLLEALVAGGYHIVLFDRILNQAQRLVGGDPELIRRKVADRSGRWVPGWVDEKLAAQAVSGLEEMLDEMRAPDHPWRLRFNAALYDLIDRLDHDPAMRARAEALKNDLAAHPGVGVLVERMGADIRQWTEAGEDGTSRAEILSVRILAGIALRLKEDEALRAALDSWIEQAARALILPNREKLGAFVAGVIRGWDAPMLVDKLERQVGRDLQYIRINGTLVGGLVGLLLHAAWAGLA